MEFDEYDYSENPEPVKEKEKDTANERHHRDKDVLSEERGREKTRNREKSRETEFPEREMERELRDKEREGSRYKEIKGEAAELQADDGCLRTVFAYQFSQRVQDLDLHGFFSKAGQVKGVHIVRDPESRCSKEAAYIEFYDAISIPVAITLSGQLLLGQQVTVRSSEAQRNLVQSNTTIVGPGCSIGPCSGRARRLYVGNLHVNITEDQLHQFVQLPLDQETGQCKGFGFVQESESSRTQKKWFRVNHGHDFPCKATTLPRTSPHSSVLEGRVATKEPSPCSRFERVTCKK